MLRHGSWWFEGDAKRRRNVANERGRRKIQESLDAMTAIKENALRRRQARELLEKGKLTICSHITYRSKVWGHYDFLINFNFYSARMH